MRVLLFLLIIAIIAGVTFIAISALYQLLVNFQPGRSKIKADLQKMKAEIQPFIDELVPWTKEEMELLSLNQINKKIKKGITTTAKGIITSIYHEPLIAWSYKRYVSPDNNAVIYARSSHHEFVFRIRKNKTEFKIDNQVIGTLRENGVLYSAKSKRLLARINRQSDELLLPVLVRDKEVASLINPEKTTKINPRAFEFLSKMDKEEEAILLSLAILEFVKNEIPRRK
jgi:hypothetical protein